MAAGITGDEDWEKWIRGLRAITQSIGIGAFNVQILAAEKVADILRQFLLDGVEPQISPLTAALKGGRNPALSDLAKHVIVERPKQRRTTPSSGPGVFMTGFHPAVVTFEKKWERIAFTLERGAVVNLTARQRAAIIQKAITAAGGDKRLVLTEGFGTGGVWIIPPRPFVHVFRSPEARQTIVDAAELVFSGKLSKRERLSTRTELEDIGDYREVSYDDVSGVLADTGWGDFVDAIEFD